MTCCCCSGSVKCFQRAESESRGPADVPGLGQNHGAHKPQHSHSSQGEFHCGKNHRPKTFFNLFLYFSEERSSVLLWGNSSFFQILLNVGSDSVWPELSSCSLWQTLVQLCSSPWSTATGRPCSRRQTSHKGSESLYIIIILYN